MRCLIQKTSVSERDAAWSSTLTRWINQALPIRFRRGFPPPEAEAWHLLKNYSFAQIATRRKAFINYQCLPSLPVIKSQHPEHDTIHFQGSRKFLRRLRCFLKEIVAKPFRLRDFIFGAKSLNASRPPRSETKANFKKTKMKRKETKPFPVLFYSDISSHRSNFYSMLSHRGDSTYLHRPMLMKACGIGNKTKTNTCNIPYTCRDLKITVFCVFVYLAVGNRTSMRSNAGTRRSRGTSRSFGFEISRYMLRRSVVGVIRLECVLQNDKK